MFYCRHKWAFQLRFRVYNSFGSRRRCSWGSSKDFFFGVGVQLWGWVNGWYPQRGGEGGGANHIDEIRSSFHLIFSSSLLLEIFRRERKRVRARKGPLHSLLLFDSITSNSLNKYSCCKNSRGTSVFTASPASSLLASGKMELGAPSGDRLKYFMTATHHLLTKGWKGEGFSGLLYYCDGIGPK